MLRSSQESFDARDLLELSMQMNRDLARFDLGLRGLQAQGRSAARNAGRTGPGSARGGNLGVEVTGLGAHVGREMRALSNDLRIFQQEQERRMNDPTRTSSGGPEDLVEAFWTLFDAFFDITARIHGQRRTAKRLSGKN